MTASRTIHEIRLRPISGSRFQPTGFPDLGAATFQRPLSGGGWEDALLLESVQSMANWLEKTTWDTGAQDQVAELASVPYVRVLTPDGEFLTSSRLEAHRLAAAYVMDAKVKGHKDGRSWLASRLGLEKGRPLDMAAVASAVFALDPLCLVHGVFFAQKPWPWQPKFARAVTCFIEAHDVRPAVSGGVKKDSVHNQAAEGGSSEGYGMVPHHRTEYTAASLTAFVSVDRAQLGSYGLAKPSIELLNALVDFELASVFGEGLRLRTACDLVVDGVEGDPLPDRAEAAVRISDAVAACGDDLGESTDVVWSPKGAKSA